MAGFRKNGEREVYRGPLVSVAVGSFTAPDGSTFERDVVHHPGAVSVVPIVDEGRAVLLVRQYRAAVDRELLEIPAGKRDVEGEDPEETARRELAEEVGMKAGRLERLVEFYNSAGFCDEHSIVFLAREMQACDTDLQGVEEEHMEVEQVPLDAVGALMAAGQIVDAKTIIGLSLARERLGMSAVPPPEDPTAACSPGGAPDPPTQ